MDLRVRVHPWARLDIEESVDFFALDAPEVALRFVRALDATWAQLAQTPSIGAPRSFAAEALEGLRSIAILGFRSHLAFYRVTPDAVEVLRVLHGARDLDSLRGE